MAGFRGHSGSFYPTNLGGNILEIVFNGLDRRTFAAVAARLREIGFCQSLDFFLRGRVLVFRAREVEFRALCEPRRLRALEKDKVLVLAHGSKRDEIQLL